MEIPVTRPAKVRQVGVAPLPDKRLQLWAVGEAGQLFSTRKTTPKPDAPWEEDVPRPVELRWRPVGDQAASSLVGVTAVVASRAARRAGRYR